MKDETTNVYIDIDDDNIGELILNALNDEKYKARTIAGVAKSTRINPSRIVTALNTTPKLNQYVKIYPRRSKAGEVLITTREKFDKYASFKDKFIDAFATKRVTIKDGY